MRYIFRLPDVGEGIHEAEIIQYAVQPGDLVAIDQIIVKIETDKAVVTLPSPAAGTVLEIPNRPGDLVRVGEPIIILQTAEIATVAPTPPEKTIPELPVEKTAPSLAVPTPPVPGKRVLATPHTRHLARELKVDINLIAGSGKGGRITDEDVRQANVIQTPSAPKIPRTAAVSHEASTIGFDFEKYGPTRREPLKGIRKRIAEVMVRSFSTIPHVSHADEADVTDLLAVIKRQKAIAEQRGVKLTLTAFIAKAVVASLKQFPVVNSSLDEESGELVFKEYFHLGIATDTENGLMVPVVKDADKKSIMQIAENIQHLAERARNREIELEELRGGTFSITNLGGIGGTHATPIIQHPQVAILAVLQARKKPVVRNDEIVMRTMLPLVLSFDHRILDGAIMAHFMNYLIRRLEDPLLMLIDLV